MMIHSMALLLLLSISPPGGLQVSLKIGVSALLKGIEHERNILYKKSEEAQFKRSSNVGSQGSWGLSCCTRK